MVAAIRLEWWPRSGWNGGRDGVGIPGRLALESADGTLIFNDYVMYDHLQRVEYGVVQAVNQLVIDGDWRVVGFALNHNMFCDIAIRRPR